MTDDLLPTIVVLEVIIVVWLLLTHATYAFIDRRRSRADGPIEAARRTLLTTVVSRRTAGAIDALQHLRPRDRDDVLCAVAANVQSRRDPLFEDMAGRVGTTMRIERDLTSARWWLRRDALRRLAILGLTADAAWPLLDDRSSHVRAAAADWLGVGADPAEAAARLTALLGDESDRVRNSAMWTLVTLGTAASPALRDALHSAQGPMLAATIRTIHLLDDPVLAKEVRVFIDHDDPSIRSVALITAAPALDIADASLLSPLITHHDADIRRAVIDAVGRAGLRPLVGPVAQALHDADGAVREAAIRALDQLGPCGELLLNHAASSEARG